MRRQSRSKRHQSLVQPSQNQASKEPSNQLTSLRANPIVPSRGDVYCGHTNMLDRNFPSHSRYIGEERNNSNVHGSSNGGNKGRIASVPSIRGRGYDRMLPVQGPSRTSSARGSNQLSDSGHIEDDAHQNTDQVVGQLYEGVEEIVQIALPVAMKSKRSTI